MSFFNLFKFILSFGFCLILISCSQFPLRGNRGLSSSEVIGFDGWSYAPKGRTIAIGDIHADPKAFLDILINKGVLDQDGNFIAKNIDLVLLGDFADKGYDTRGVWDIIDYIEKAAVNKNSRVHSLFGNHDTVILMGELKRMKGKDLEKFSSFHSDAPTGVKKALVSEPYKSMMRKWKGIVKIGQSIYVHGGISNFIYKMHPAQINATVNEYVIAQQEYLEKVLAGLDSNPPEVPKILAPWKFDSKSPMPDNPFWTRVAAKHGLSQAEFDRMLGYLDAERVIVGHTPTDSKRIQKILGGKMVLADTNNSIGFKSGKLSAVEINEKTGAILDSNNLKRGVNRSAYIKIVNSAFKGMNSCIKVFFGPLKHQ